MVLHGSHQQNPLYVSINIPAPWILYGQAFAVLPGSLAAWHGGNDAGNDAGLGGL